MATVAAWAHEPDSQLLERASSEIASRPQEAALYERRAILYLELHEWQACLVDLEHAERLGLSGLNVLRARALFIGRHFEQAIEITRSCEDSATAWLVRAEAEAAVGRLTLAAIDFQKALDLMPNPEPDHFLEATDVLCRAGRARDALELLDRAPQTIVMVERAMQIEAPDAALKRLDALIAASQVKEPLLAKKAVFLAQNGREAESSAVWRMLAERIISLPPQARGSHAMSKLAQQAHHALAALQHTHSTP